MGESADLCERCHGGVAWKSGQQSAVRPSELEGLGGSLAREQAIKEPRGKAVAAAHAVVNIQFTHWRLVCLTLDPGRRAPAVPVRGMHFPPCGSNDLDL